MPVYYNNVGENWFKKKDEVVSEANDNEKIKKANDLLKQIKDKIVKKISYDLLYDLTDAFEKLDRMSNIRSDRDVENLLHLTDVITRLTENGDIDFKLIDKSGGDIIDLLQKTDMEQYLEYY